MDLSLTEEQIAVRETFDGLFAKESTPTRIRKVEDSGFDAALWGTLQSIGTIGIGVPVERGGGGGGLLELALIAHEAGRRVAPVPLAEPAAVARLAATARADEVLAAVFEGGEIISLATRPGALNRQILVDGGIADAAIAFEDNQLVLHRPVGAVRTIPNLGGLPLARWEATTTEVVMVGPGASALYEHACDEVRLLRASALVGLAAEAIEIGAAYARERHAFGVPIGIYQAVAHPLADALTANDGAQLLVFKAAWALEEGLPIGPELASMAFIFAAETAYAAAQHSLHLHGGYGFMEEYDIQLYYRRAKAWALAFSQPDDELLTLADRRFGPRGRP
jgi:alkylation response protein AidB-like acyl-CoA dehydrogenase